MDTRSAWACAVLLGASAFGVAMAARSLVSLARRVQSLEASSGLPVPPSAPVPLLTHLPYSHGGFMGAAVAMLREKKWRELLHTLTPASSRRVALAHAGAILTGGDGASSSALMRDLENNPVLAAFGTADAVRRGKGRDPATGAHNPIVVELDVYLAPEHTSSSSPSSFSSSSALDVASRTVVSHGSLLQTAAERLLGYSMHASLLLETGGMTIPKWIEVYLEALSIAAPHVRVHDGSTDAGAAGGGNPWSPSPSPSPLLSVFLDVKSASASPQTLHALVRGLNAMGVHVWGIGSFVHPQVTGLVRCWDDDNKGAVAALRPRMFTCLRSLPPKPVG
jgi:hypothetical protein